MKELKQHIRIIPVEGSVTDAFDLMADKPFFLEFTADSDDAGTYWKCQKTIIIDMPDAPTCRFFHCQRSCQIQVWDNSGACHTIGYDGMPARVLLSPMLQTATLSIESEMPWNPLSL